MKKQISNEKEVSSFLEERVRRLEIINGQTLKLVYMLIAIILFLIAVGFVATKPDVKDTTKSGIKDVIQVKNLQIVDNNNKVKGEFGIDQDGEVHIAIVSSNGDGFEVGKENGIFALFLCKMDTNYMTANHDSGRLKVNDKITISCTDSGSGLVFVRNGQLRLGLGALDDSSGMYFTGDNKKGIDITCDGKQNRCDINMKDGNGCLRSSIGLNSDDIPFFTMFNANSISCVNLGFGNDDVSPSIRLLSQNGYQAGLVATNSSSVLALQDDTQPRLVAGVSGLTFLTFYDSNGNMNYNIP